MRRVSSRRLIAVLVLSASVFGIAASARESRADVTAKEMTEIEAAIRRVAVEATPKTLCVRVTMKDGHEGFGSGAIISADGLVLTCAHVTEPSRGGKLTAVFPDGTEALLRVVASNAHNDYSLCRIDGKRTDLPFFEIAPIEPIPGDWVVALGHPGGPFADHKPTIAAGKVTGLHRSLPILMEGKEYVGAIQTDAPLFGGNSGGPLVDLFGRLVGINGAILLAGDASFASSAVRIAKDLPALRAGKNVAGEKIGDLFSALSDLTSDLDPDALSDAVADEGMKAMLKAASSFGIGGAGGGEPKARAKRRTDDLKAAWPTVKLPVYTLTADGKPVALATWVGIRGHEALYVTTSRAARSAGTLRFEYEAQAGHVLSGNITVRGVDGEWDLGLLSQSYPGGDESLPPVAPDDQCSPGSFVLVPGGDQKTFQAGVISAVDRTVGTERKIPTLGIVRLFQPPHTSPFRPYPAMIQIDCPLDADEMGGPVVRPDGSLVGIAVAHFCGGVTMVVPAKVLAASVEKMLQGIDTPAPKTYGPPSRPTPDRKRLAERAVERQRDADALVIYVPTLSGVLKPVKFVNSGADGAAPTAPDDSGVGPLDVHAGDALVSIDGTATPTTDAARKAIAALATDAHAIVVVRRGGADVRYDATAEGSGKDRKRSLGALAK
jgi:S1-C subfamily serine protease